MRREGLISQPHSENYLFNFPLMGDGLNYGNLPESQYITKLRNYGSTSTTPNFNDNLTFDSYYGELAHRHAGCKDKLVSLIDYQNFDLNAWLNANDYELNLDFYFYSYSGYQQIIEMMRNPIYYTPPSSYYVGYDLRWLSGNYGILFWSGISDSSEIRLIGSSPTYVTRVWVNMNIKKVGGTITAVYKRMDNDNILSTNTFTAPTLVEGKNPRYLTLFGYYQEGASLNSSRYCTGATKNFYLKKL